MPIKVRRSAAFVNVPNGTLFVKYNGAWVSPVTVRVKRGGIWALTDFTGKPNAPTQSIYSDDYTHIQVAVTAPTLGTATATLRTSLCNSGGTVLQTIDTAATPGAVVYPNFTGLVADTPYIIRSWALSAGGILSIVSTDLRRQTGHPEQGYNQPNYGWGAESGAVRPGFTRNSQSPTSEHENGQYGAGRSCDPDPASSWVGGPKTAATFFEGCRYSFMTGNRLLYSISAVANSQQAIYLGLYWYPNGWLGSVTPDQIGMSPKPDLLNHNFLWGVNNLTVRKWIIPGYNINLGYQDLTMDLGITNLIAWPLAYRVELNDVYYTYKDWVVVSFTYVVTVNAAGNSNW